VTDQDLKNIIFLPQKMFYFPNPIIDFLTARPTPSTLRWARQPSLTKLTKSHNTDLRSDDACGVKEGNAVHQRGRSVFLCYKKTIFHSQLLLSSHFCKAAISIFDGSRSHVEQ
jgi:hypothetical protein